jgi:hypothetical protein
MAKPLLDDDLSSGAGQRHPGNPDGEPGLQCPRAGDLDEGPGREHHRVRERQGRARDHADLQHHRQRL